MCKVGDWILNRHSRQIYVIVNICSYSGEYWIENVKELGTRSHYDKAKNLNDFISLGKLTPMAQLLYSNSINK